MKEPNRTMSIAQCGIGRVTQSARKFLKRLRARHLRRYARVDLDCLSPKAVHRGWYW